jgi:hypothetical protein
MTIYAIEELQGFDGLEIEELVTKEQETAKSGEYAELKDYVDNVVEAQNAASDEAESGDLGGDVAEGEASADDANDAPSDDPEGTEVDADAASDGNDSPSTQSDNKADESSAEKKDGADKKEGETDEEDPLTEKDGKKTTAVAESLRQEHYERLILEALETSDITAALGSVARGTGRLVGHGVMAVGQFGLETLGRLAGVLKDLGIEYSPVVAKAIKLGVIYLYTKSVKSLFKLIVGVSDWAKRYYRNIDKRQKEIHDLRAALEKLRSLNEPVSLEGKRFVTSDVLSWLTTEHAVNPMNSAGVVSRFFTTAVSEIDRAMQYDVSLVKKLIELSETGVRGELTGYLKVQPFSGAFLRRNVKGYVKDPELVESFVYREALPDSVLFVATLPRRELKDMEAIGHAYQASGIFLAVDDRARPAADGIDYMDIEALAKYLNVLEGLCESAKTHKAFFARIIKDAEALKFGYKHYYQKMVESEEQATIRSSLVEYVYHKQSFTTKVYAPAAMDVHDYVTAYLLRALRFAKANVRALSP